MDPPGDSDSSGDDEMFPSLASGFGNAGSEHESDSSDDGGGDGGGERKIDVGQSAPEGDGCSSVSTLSWPRVLGEECSMATSLAGTDAAGRLIPATERSQSRVVRVAEQGTIGAGGTASVGEGGTVGTHGGRGGNDANGGNGSGGSLGSTSTFLDAPNSRGDWRAAVQQTDTERLSMAELLGRLGMGWFAETLEEYEVKTVADLQALGRGPSNDLLAELGATDTDIFKIHATVFPPSEKGGREAGTNATGSEGGRVVSGSGSGSGSGAGSSTAPTHVPTPKTTGEVAAWLSSLRSEAVWEARGLRVPAVEEHASECSGGLDGDTLRTSLDSTRELRDTFGLHTVEGRLAFERAATDFLDAGEYGGGYGGGGAGAVTAAGLPRGSAGGIFSRDFLRITAPLYDLHMGCENMGPMLYTLVRFLKPRRVLEVGAGYTSIFILQALADNLEEMRSYGVASAAGECKCGEMPWCVESKVAPFRPGAEGAKAAEGAEGAGGAEGVEGSGAACGGGSSGSSSDSAGSSGSSRHSGDTCSSTGSGGRGCSAAGAEGGYDALKGVLHCIDNLAHKATTAHKVLEVAERLGTLGGNMRKHDMTSTWFICVVLN